MSEEEKDVYYSVQCNHCGWKETFLEKDKGNFFFIDLPSLSKNIKINKKNVVKTVSRNNHIRCKKCGRPAKYSELKQKKDDNEGKIFIGIE